MKKSVAKERIQKVLANLGVASRRQIEAWIQVGRITVNDKPAVLGQGITTEDKIKIDGQLVFRREATPKLANTF